MTRPVRLAAARLREPAGALRTPPRTAAPAGSGPPAFSVPSRQGSHDPEIQGSLAIPRPGGLAATSYWPAVLADRGNHEPPVSAQDPGVAFVWCKWCVPSAAWGHWSFRSPSRTRERMSRPLRAVRPVRRRIASGAVLADLLACWAQPATTNLRRGPAPTAGGGCRSRVPLKTGSRPAGTLVPASAPSTPAAPSAAKLATGRAAVIG
jgi:hypothetical protein